MICNQKGKIKPFINEVVSLGAEQFFFTGGEVPVVDEVNRELRKAGEVEREIV